MVVISKWIRHHSSSSNQELIQPGVEDIMQAVDTAVVLRIRGTGVNKDEHWQFSISFKYVQFSLDLGSIK